MAFMDADILLHHALILTLEEGTAPIPGGYVAVTGRRIAAVGAATDARDLPPARQALDLQGALVLPGLVNTHCHAPMVWFRGLADDLPLQTWLTDFIFPAEAAWLDPDKAYGGTLAAAAEMSRGGITTVADGYFFETEVRRALAQAGLRACAAQGVVRSGIHRAGNHLRRLLPCPLHLRGRNPHPGQGPDPDPASPLVHPPGRDAGRSGRQPA
ncbi:MAG: amidohydrolase family protein, partial [Deltaproteobacteria bacterium]|nr:amidohydrolase family protein [Deltaproteobacteria bacterium]